MKIQKDTFGPEHVIKMYDPKIGMRSFLVIDNTAYGPDKGALKQESFGKGEANS